MLNPQDSLPSNSATNSMDDRQIILRNINKAEMAAKFGAANAGKPAIFILLDLRCLLPRSMTDMHSDSLLVVSLKI